MNLGDDLVSNWITDRKFDEHDLGQNYDNMDNYDNSLFNNQSHIVKEIKKVTKTDVTTERNYWLNWI